ncbi:hypothetical protein CHLNCDRAFT_137957 [Chlorella variabilis]|uniref:ABC transporter domain-containing protein n=1 Tax=Chlorella variabilis TaxID=554065 RepID=E1Z4Y0_CHLVA|nr:hypothetical protein CHLNCDRAFT_137957 [Chlorella variabilis]EFN59136.1 hypothetical protein CHLNCDRAFT_137957 [Chlorella variabilis]|eukprot:XP_005851238.1 hypothetical protein CHLNCDRAFT_137957 [Chlorella variabilis]
MTLNMAAAPQGDLPWLEARRGGRRSWIEDDGGSVARSTFSRTSQATSDRGDDFEELKAAALLGIKGKHRDHVVVLPPHAEGQGVQVVDVQHMDRRSQRELMERMLRHGQADNMLLLERVAQRLERAGLQPPTVEVRYRGLSVLSKMTVGDRALPTLRKTVKRQAEPALRALGRAPPKTLFPIIDEASGIIKPGDFTILLGPPGSGKTTFLRTLAGLNRRHTSLKASGQPAVQAQELSYNGRGFDEFVVERSAAYVDDHYGELTVRETFDLSARFQSSGYKKAVLEELAAKERELCISPDPEVDAYMRATAVAGKGNLMVEVIIRLLGLDICADTVVGNAMLRGISGGQKKRVTTGKAGERAQAWRVLLGIMRAFKNVCHLYKATLVVGLLQPQPETFDLFDTVILLASGKARGGREMGAWQELGTDWRQPGAVCYHGPREGVLPFFGGIGFVCPPRRGVADFLQQVATPSDQHKYWDMRNQRPYRHVSVLMIENAFKKTELWQGVESQLAQPFDASSADPRALATTKYGQTYSHLLRTNFRRMILLQTRNKIFTIIRTSQVLLMAFVVSTLFWREDKGTVEDGNLFFGVIFYSILYQLLGAIPEMHLLVGRLSVFFKQRDVNFYPGWCFAIPTFLMRVPWSFLEATLWTNLVYWLVGFSPSVRFLMLQLFLINIWSVGLFQLIAAVTRNDTIATAVGSFFLLIFISLTGAPPRCRAGARMLCLLLLFAWVTRALAINEFTAAHWMRPNPSNPGSTLGIDVLQFRGFPTEYWWTWASVGFVLASLALLLLLFIATMTFIGAPRQRRTITPEALQDFQLSRKELLTPQPSFAEQDMAEQGMVAWPSTATQGTSSTNKSGRLAAADSATAPGTEPLAGAPAGPAAEDGAVRVTVTPLGGPTGAAGRSSSFEAGEEPISPRHLYLMRSSQRMSQASQQAEVYRQRTAIPFDFTAITFRDVEYSVPLPPDADPQRADVPASGPHQGALRLLRGIHGVFRPHVLTALMGASGAGKSTLLDCLAGRKTSGLITGDIRVNGFPKDQHTFARVAGYVEQTDVHMPQTTVAEACHFSARVRLPTSVEKGSREAFVEEAMALVELDRLRHAHVGVPGVSGLSVEQRKRLTLAVELVSNPSVVFMDEPTSGLDARAAGVVMDAVRATVDTGRTVVCTIHQPSADIFEAFDELLLLKPGGSTVYFGPLGDDSQALIRYFQGIPGVRPLPPNYNPANWMLEVTSPGAEEAPGVDFAQLYAKSDLARQMDGVISQHHEPKAGAAPPLFSELHASGFGEQFLVNLRRNFTIYNRSPEYNLTRAAVTTLIGFSFGGMFWRQGDNRSTVAGVLNIMGVLFSSTLFLGISNCLTVQHLIAAQRTVFYREHAAGMYRVAPFALAQQLVELPYLVVQALAYSCIVYWMVWFARDAAKFFWFYFLFFLTLWYFTTLGMAAVNLTPSVPLANVLCSFFFGFWNLLSGFLIPIPAMPGYWVWAAWINPVMWSIYGMVVSQLGSFSNETITNLSGVTETIPQFLSDTFQYETYMQGVIVAILFAYILAFSSVAMISLKLLNFQRR